MASKTSAAVKNKYNAKAYDRLQLVVPKGKKDEIKAFATAQGESVNGYINRLIESDMNKAKKE